MKYLSLLKYLKYFEALVWVGSRSHGHIEIECFPKNNASHWTCLSAALFVEVMVKRNLLKATVELFDKSCTVDRTLIVLFF